MSRAQGLAIPIHRLRIVHHLPDDPKEAAAIRRKAPKFYYNVITRAQYRQSHDGILLHCLSHKEAQEILKEAMTVCVELTNLVQNVEIKSKDSDNFWQR